MQSLLLVDDNATLLEGLRARLASLLAYDDVDIRVWTPTREKEPSTEFDSNVDDETVLVVTDYDLTSQGVKGLFGLTIVGWCQNRLIPVGDFSRGNVTALPKEPNLFELRIPNTEADAASYIASTFKGFSEIRHAVAAQANLASKQSLATLLSGLLGRPRLDNQFALYMSRLGSANSALIQFLQQHIKLDNPPQNKDKVRLLSYVLGHVLLNAILKFPGPILSDHALCAYTATSTAEIIDLAGLFSSARYTGPFSGGRQYYWRDDVDAVLDDLGSGLEDREFDTLATYNRAAVESRLGRSLSRHCCERCGGINGGFLCPFTQRTVCQRSDCSVSASSWVPQGAQLSRVERDFYDEWAPLLGL